MLENGDFSVDKGFYIIHVHDSINSNGKFNKNQTHIKEQTLIQEDTLIITWTNLKRASRSMKTEYKSNTNNFISYNTRNIKAVVNNYNGVNNKKRAGTQMTRINM